MNKVELHRALTRVLIARIPRDCIGDVELLRDYIENSEPVKHGQWINGRCTHCGEDVASKLDIWTNVQNFIYCPNCGTRMDGDSK